MKHASPMPFFVHRDYCIAIQAFEIEFTIHNFWVDFKAPRTPQVVRAKRLLAPWRCFFELLTRQSRPLDGLSIHSQKLKNAAAYLAPGRHNKQEKTKK